MIHTKGNSILEKDRTEWLTEANFYLLSFEVLLMKVSPSWWPQHHLMGSGWLTEGGLSFSFVAPILWNCFPWELRWQPPCSMIWNLVKMKHFWKTCFCVADLFFCVLSCFYSWALISVSSATLFHFSWTILSTYIAPSQFKVRNIYDPVVILTTSMESR